MNSSYINSLTSKSDEWATPSFIYKQVQELGFFDPCSLGSWDGLFIEWKAKNYINPPFSLNSEFVEKALIECDQGKSCLLLLPVRTSTNYFKKLFVYGCAFIFIIGRLAYNDANCAPFPSCFVIPLGGGRGNNRIEFIERDLIDISSIERKYFK